MSASSAFGEMETDRQDGGVHPYSLAEGAIARAFHWDDMSRLAMLPIKYLQLKASFGWSLSNLVALLRQQLFVYRDLWIWLDNPFQAPKRPPPLADQLPIEFA